MVEIYGSARLNCLLLHSTTPTQSTMLLRISSALVYLAIGLVCLLYPAAANVEKEIFLGPSASTDVPLLGGRLIPRLANSEHCSNCRAIRTRLDTSFVGKGAEHWVRIDGLEEGRRYEVRICWAATVRTLLRASSFWTPLTCVWPATDGFHAGSFYPR